MGAGVRRLLPGEAENKGPCVCSRVWGGVARLGWASAGLCGRELCEGPTRRTQAPWGRPRMGPFPPFPIILGAVCASHGVGGDMPPLEGGWWPWLAEVRSSGRGPRRFLHFLAVLEAPRVRRW